MKKIMMIAIMMVAALSVNAQEAKQMFVKPMVGGTLSKYTGDVEDMKFKLGFVGGVEFGYYVSNQFALTASFLFAMEGTKVKDVPYTYKRDVSSTLTYLNVPLLANFYITKSLSIKAGIQPGFMLSAEGKSMFLFDDRNEHVTAEFDISGTHRYNKFDLSIPMGISYEIDGFVIDARYSLGLLKINKNNNDNEFYADYEFDGYKYPVSIYGYGPKVKNAEIMLTVSYKINL